MSRMQGKVALVSGGSEGIGEAVARLIVAEGGSVMLGDVQLEKAQALAAASGGADYIGFGPIFGTTTKERPDPMTGVERLAAAMV